MLDFIYKWCASTLKALSHPEGICALSTKILSHSHFDRGSAYIGCRWCSVSIKWRKSGKLSINMLLICKNDYCLLHFFFSNFVSPLLYFIWHIPVHRSVYILYNRSELYLCKLVWGKFNDYLQRMFLIACQKTFWIFLFYHLYNYNFTWRHVLVTRKPETQKYLWHFLRFHNNPWAA